MIRIIVIIAALIFASSASAEHHRGHAFGQLGEAKSKIEYAITRLNRFLEVYEPGSAAKPDYKIYSLEGNIRLSLNKALDEIAAAEAAINNDDLFSARRFLSQPKNENPKSASFHLWSATYTINGLYGSLSLYDSNGNWSNARSQMLATLSALTHARSAIEWGEWHVVDSIREEIYLDQDAICAGANNHCE